MRLPFIVKLLRIFNEKEDILEKLQELVNPIAEIVKDPAIAYEEGYEALVLQHHPFHEDTGFLPLTDKWIQLNENLFRYKDEEDKTSLQDEKGISMDRNLERCGIEIHQSYLRIMGVVKKEQHFLVDWFRPTLEEISRRSDYKKDWVVHLSHFRSLLKLLETDLQYFELLVYRLEQRGYLDFLKQVAQETAVQPEQVANALIQETVALEGLERQAKQAEEPPSVIREIGIQGKENRAAIAIIRETSPAIERKVPQIKRVRRSLWERFRKRFSGNLAQAVNHGLNVLSKSRQLRARLSTDINESLQRAQEAAMSRRRFMKMAGVGAVGAAAASIGVGYLLKDQEKPVVARKEEFPQPHQPLPQEPVSNQPLVTAPPDKTFAKIELPEVDKIIQTEGSYQNALYAVVIPHSSELDSLKAARMAAKGPITFVAGNRERNLKIKTSEGVVQIDPNRVFSEQGWKGNFRELQGGDWKSLASETQAQLRDSISVFTDIVSQRVFKGKMVLALHQNTKGNFGIRSYRDNPRFAKFADNVSINPEEPDDEFAYVNTEGWFEALKSRGWNVILQKNLRTLDDGSISYASTWKNTPYINIEVRLGDHERQAKMIETVNDLIETYPPLAEDMNFVPSDLGPLASVPKGRA